MTIGNDMTPLAFAIDAGKRECVVALVEAKADVCKVRLPNEKPLPTWLRGCAPTRRMLTLTTAAPSLPALQRLVWSMLKLDAMNDYVLIDTRTDACPALLTDTAACTMRAGDAVVAQPISWLIGCSNKDEQCLQELQHLRTIGMWTGHAALEMATSKVSLSPSKLALADNSS